MLFQSSPVPTYPEYEELLTEAERRSAACRFVDPARLYESQSIVDRRGWDWAEAVLGRTWPGVGGISVVEDHLIKVADERGVNPPEPEYLAEGRRRAAERAEQLRLQREEATRRDVERWNAALAGAAQGAEFEVFTHTVAQVRQGSRHNLGHAVPKADVYSGVRKLRTHPAGRALCETEQRRPLRLHGTPEPEGVPGTCVRCLEWVPKVRATR